MKTQWILLPLLTMGLVACGGHTPKAMSLGNTTQTSDTNTNDEMLNQNIKSALNNKEDLSPNAKQIRIIIANGTVTLRGLVKDNQEKSQIEDVVYHVDGVKKVDNQLDVQDIEIGS